MEWNGFECIEFQFDGQDATIVIPNKKVSNPTLAIKTEYFNAFPETEIELLERGFYLGYIDNENRWGTDADLDRKAEFVKYLTEEYSLNSKCVPIGMSCGGIFGVKFAAKYPELTACLYLDAPVVNYMSCPCGFGNGNPLNADNSEILNALNLDSIAELLAYRDMPLDKLPALVESRIPIVLVAGDSDKTVPYEENGAFIEKAYKNTDIDLEVYIKKGCEHHPHGLDDPTPIVEFIEKHTIQ